MDSIDQVIKSKVLKIETEEQWDFYTSQANNQHRPVIVHFTACWCMPSVAMNHYFEELAHNYDKFLFLVVDVDDVKTVASKMDVKAMPTFVLLGEGVEEERVIGANPEEIRKRIEGLNLLRHSTVQV